MGGKKFFNGIDLQSNRATNAASPSSSTDLANKGYVDNLVAGLQWKPAVRAATTAAGTLTTSYANGSVIDGVTLGTNDRILVKNQGTGSENGLYIVNSAGAPTRTTDADGAGEIGPNATVFVSEGTVNADTAWTVTNNGTITIGTTSIVFAQFGGGAVYTAGNGLNVSSNVFSVVPGTGILADGTSTRIDPSVVVRKYATTIGDGSSTSITVTHSLSTRDVQVSLYDSSTYEEVETDIVYTSTSAVTLTFATAPASSAYRCTVHA